MTNNEDIKKEADYYLENDVNITQASKKYKEERRGIKHEQSSSCILEWNRKHRDHGK